MKRLVVCMLAFAGMLAAQPGPPAGFEPGGPRLQGLQEYFGLTDAQLDQLKANRKALFEEVKTVAEEAHKLRMQLRESIDNAEVTDAQLGALLRQAERVQARIKTAHEAKNAEAVALINQWGYGDKLKQLQSAAEVGPLVGQAAALGLIDRPDGQRGQAGMRPGGFAPGGGGPMGGHVRPRMGMMHR